MRLKSLPLNKVHAGAIQPLECPVSPCAFNPFVVPAEVFENRFLALEHPGHIPCGLNERTKPEAKRFRFVIPVGHLVPPMVGLEKPVMGSRYRTLTPDSCHFLGQALRIGIRRYFAQRGHENIVVLSDCVAACNIPKSCIDSGAPLSIAFPYDDLVDPSPPSPSSRGERVSGDYQISFQGLMILLPR